MQAVKRSRNQPRHIRHGLTLALAACVAGLSLGLGTTTAPAQAATRLQAGIDVSIDGGPIHGVAASDLRVFRGIPYAAPPTGARRFNPPAAPTSWSTRRDATAFGPSCIQPSANLGYNLPSSFSEDCLTLNVWSHKVQSANDPLRPVLVWVHGGGFTGGGSAGTLFESSRLARQGKAVVVTLNYRLGALGFLVTDALKAESTTGAVGNYGLLDQRAALAWVQRNIEIFGGDPNNVTLFGESAGGASVCAHMAMPESRGLFAKAIIESGGRCSEFPTLTTDPLMAGGALARGQEFMGATPCVGSPTPLTCLRGLRTDDILYGQDRIATNFFGSKTIGPVVDSVTLKGSPYALLAADATARKPLLIGANQNESGIFIAMGGILNHSAGYIYSYDDYHRLALAMTGDATRAKALESVYPLGTVPSRAMIPMITEYWYTCPARQLSQLFASSTPTYHYDFGGSLSGGGWFVGPTHGVELAFVFGNLDALSYTAWNSSDRALSDRMIGLWSRFAASANPAGSPIWSGAASGTYLLQESNTRMTSTLVSGRCETLRRLGLLPGS